ncbi:MAG: hypothetical protein KDC61_18595, partial [Saprospiraceae bacterium]|nr:hypothetical protein [Saprospiraceae bacterium]
PFVMRDRRGQALWIYPVQYNPVQKVMRVYTSITLRVYRKAGSGDNELQNTADHNASPAFEQIFRKMFLNYTPGVKSRGNTDPEKMLVITTEALLEELEPLITWKRQMGIHTDVVTVEEIGSSEADDIYNYVKDYYQTEGITYLLLVGDEDAIKSQMRPSGGTLYTCDNCFG